MTCFRCKKVLTEPPQPMAPVFKLIASLSLAPLHGGLWAMEEFSKEYCDRCRKRLSALSVLLALLVLLIAGMVLKWVLGKGFLKFLH